MTQRHQSIAQTVDAIMSGAQRRFGHGLFFMEQNGGDQQGQQGGQQQGQQGGDGGDSGGGNTGLLDDEASHGDAGGDNGGDGGQAGQGGSGGGNADEDALVDRITKALEGRFDSIADRRVNAILKEVRNGGQTGGQNGDQQGQQQGGQQGSSQTDRSGDLREARLVYREYVADEIKFLGNEEREHAMTLAQGLLDQRVRSGEDPETAGREVAKTVASQIKALRTHYENKTVAALKRRGVIPETATTGQPPRGPQRPGPTSGWKSGEAKAAELFGDRMPQQQQQ